MATSATVAVVGAGLSGAACARALTDAGVAVEVLDLSPPLWTRLQRWTYARPVQLRENRYLLGTSMVGLCGDGWGAPRVETAWISGTRLGRALAERLGRRPAT
jgi:predicted NAD/FAD-dependent oxidoreductase